MKKKDANISEVLNAPYFVKNLFCIIFCCHVLLLGYVTEHSRGREVSQLPAECDNTRCCIIQF